MHALEDEPGIREWEGVAVWNILRLETGSCMKASKCGVVTQRNQPRT